MNKKQLSLQNSSLFAELERKAKEIEILNIRLEEAEQKVESLTLENEGLISSLEKAKAENGELIEKNKELESALDNAIIETSESNNTAQAEISTENEEIQQPLTQLDLDIAQKINEVAEIVENTESAIPTDEVAHEEEPLPTIPPVAEQPCEKVTAQNTVTPPVASKSFENDNKPNSANADLLRDYGAKTIGKVTRVTAEVLSKVGSLNTDATESLKTLALGKNESFKFQIIELAKQPGDPERIMAEMDFLADEAIVYLRSI